MDMQDKPYKIINGDSLAVLDTLEENSIDAIVTDPPYGLTSITKRFGKEDSAPCQFGKDGSFARLSRGFMGKEWDGSGIEYNVELWRKALRVLKPGGYLVAFGGSRTVHRIACAIEDAGFEIRDTIMWLYGSGFPKSMSISKGLDAREKYGKADTRSKREVEQSCEGEAYTIKQTNNGAMGELIETTRKDYVPSSEAAKQWDGWGTCLKPAYEPIIIARKPFAGSLIDNVLEYGVGGINIDGCRIPLNEGETIATNVDFTDQKQSDGWGTNRCITEQTTQGRFPANVVFTYDDSDFEEVCGNLPITTSNYNENNKHETEIHRERADVLKYGYAQRMETGFNDSGSAARYFYCAKASGKDRDEGLENFTTKGAEELLDREEGSDGASWNGEYSSGNAYAGAGAPKKNVHPTVKPTTLMQYLIRLVAPKGSTILDIFNGSGSTGKAVMFENKERDANYKYIGIELDPEYCEISKARIEWALTGYSYVPENVEPTQVEKKDEYKPVDLLDF